MSYAQQAQELATLMEARLGTRGADLQAKVSRAGRRLPRAIRSQAHVVILSAQLQNSPKLARQIDQAATQAAFDDCKTYFNSLDKSERRKNLALSILAANALNVVIILALVMVVLFWRGFI